MTAAGSAANGPSPLPPLRGDLQIELLPVRGGGFPAVIVTDPARGNYFRLAWPESGIILLWDECTTVEELCLKLCENYGVASDADAIQSVAQFAFANQLTETDQEGSWLRYATLHAAGRHGWLGAALHGYLFFRIPLLHPQETLCKLLPWLSFVYQRSFWIALLAIAVLGLHLAVRQWTAVLSAAQDVLKLDGLHIFAAAILGLKAIHELGHGLTTVRHGCCVPTMGVAFMLAIPVLYTDTSDSWRLARRSQRLAIIFAGVAAELIVATLAILLWSFLAEGLLRQICFAFATTSIVLSIAINLNPFMRYDGYFALSDYLGIPNLQSRSFALGSWRLREILFDLRHPAPEKLPRRTERGLVVYAVLTSIYRLFLFLGIAAVVYLMFGKAIGIILGSVEIGFFIALPIARELKTWWRLRREIVARQRARWTFGSSAALSALMFIPWISTVEVPAVLAADREEAIYLPSPARLAAIHIVNGQVVRTGQILFAADAADLEQQRHKAELEQRAFDFQARRLHASDKEREGRFVLESKLARARERLEAIERQIDQLVIRAPFDGMIVDVDPEISDGLWLNSKRQLAYIVSLNGMRAKGVISDSDVERISSGARGVFVPDDAASVHREIVLTSIAPAADGKLAEPMLADRHGGTVPAGDERGELRTRQGWFEVAFASSGAAGSRVMRGIVRVDALPVSPAQLLWRQVARVLAREQGF